MQRKREYLQTSENSARSVRGSRKMLKKKSSLLSLHDVSRSRELPLPSAYEDDAEHQPTDRERRWSPVENRPSKIRPLYLTTRPPMEQMNWWMSTVARRRRREKTPRLHPDLHIGPAGERGKRARAPRVFEGLRPAHDFPVLLSRRIEINFIPTYSLRIPKQPVHQVLPKL